jgi:ketol-acid reductoisomerase
MRVRDEDVSLEAIRAAHVAVIGFGNQGRAHALNLRDGGIRVTVGAREGRSAERARAEGFAVATPALATRGAHIVMLLVPDEEIGGLFAREVRPALERGAAIGVAHGSALHFGALETPDDADVFLVAPAGPGVALRSRFTEGSGIPALVAIHHDATGSCRARALAYAKAIGCTRAGVFMTSVREETIVDLFGEQAVLCGGLAELVSHGFQALVDAGYAPEVAYLECVHQIELTASLVSRLGIEGMWKAVSRTAAYGGLVTGPLVLGEATRMAMAEALRAIESGEFYEAFARDAARGGPELAALRADALGEGLKRTEREVRSQLGAGEKND